MLQREGCSDPDIATDDSPADLAPVGIGLALAALLLNILILPGLGSTVGGQESGWLQLLLTGTGLILAFIPSVAAMGAVLMLTAWVWALASGIRLVLATNEATTRPKGSPPI